MIDKKKCKHKRKEYHPSWNVYDEGDIGNYTRCLDCHKVWDGDVREREVR